MYINSPCVIAGVHQDVYSEVDINYLKNNGIELVRRTGGGGAVYHDYGNIIFEHIMIGDIKNFGNFEFFAKPIIDALNDLGITGVKMTGKNDIVVMDKNYLVCLWLK